MKRFVNPLARRQKPGYPAAIARITAIVRDTLALPEDMTVSISELVCHEPNCPDIETVIAILSADSDPLTIRFPTAIPDLTEAELTPVLQLLDPSRLRTKAP